MNAGLNLFSIRNLIKTEDNFLQTALELSNMGYTSMQYSGGEYDPDRISRVSKSSGLPVVLTHVPYDRIINETEQLMSEHEKFDCKCIGLGALNSQLLMDESSFKSAIESLDKAAEKMASNGFRFCYHHHAFEFFKLSNKETAFDYMLKNSSNINFTMDTYWLQYGGADVLSTLQRTGNRVAFIHLKDYMVGVTQREDGKYKFDPTFAPVGDGNIDFAPIVEFGKKVNVVDFLVEQDNAALLPNTLEQVKRSIEYIKKEL